MPIQTRSSSTQLNTDICGFLHLVRQKATFSCHYPPAPALSGAKEMRMGITSLLPSWTTVCTNKWSERATQRMEGTSGECSDGGPNSCFSQKEKDVHTKTSTAVLFIRGANLETTSKCPAAGKGEQTTMSHSVECPQEWGGSKEGALRPGPVSYRGFTTKGGAACSCGHGADASLPHP